jgi:hypothetical protein
MDAFKDIKMLSPERKQIAKIFNKHINNAIAELERHYNVDVSGDYFSKTIKIQIEVIADNGIP